MRRTLLAASILLAPSVAHADPLPPGLDACVVGAEMCVEAVESLECKADPHVCFEPFETCIEGWPDFSWHCRYLYATCIVEEVVDPELCAKVETACPNFGDG